MSLNIKFNVTGLERAESELVERELEKVYRELYPAELPRAVRAARQHRTWRERLASRVRALRWLAGHRLGPWIAGVDLCPDDEDDE